MKLLCERSRSHVYTLWPLIAGCLLCVAKLYFWQYWGVSRSLLTPLCVGLEAAKKERPRWLRQLRKRTPLAALRHFVQKQMCSQRPRRKPSSSQVLGNAMQGLTALAGDLKQICREYCASVSLWHPPCSLTYTAYLRTLARPRLFSSSDLAIKTIL